MRRFGEVFYDGMERGQRIAFTIAVALGIAMCVGLTLGKFTPPTEYGHTPSVAHPALTTAVVTDEVTEIEPKEMRVICVTADSDFDLATREATIGRSVDLLDTTSPLPSALREVK